MEFEEEVKIQKDTEELLEMKPDENILVHLMIENKHLREKMNMIIKNKRFFDKKITELGNLDNKMKKNLTQNYPFFEALIQNCFEELLQKQQIPNESSTIENLSDSDKKVIISKAIVSRLSKKFLKENYGKYIAITLTGNILSIKDSLKNLNEDLAPKNISEDYYIEKIGFKEIVKL